MSLANCSETNEGSPAGSAVARLPKFLQPSAAGQLVRLGRGHDGGYVLEQSSVSDADALVGLGLNDDWSFEEDFTARNDVPVYAFDPTISRKIFTKRAIKSLAYVHRPGQIAHSFKVLNSYNSFFKGRRVHEKKYVGGMTVEDIISFRDIFSDIVGRDFQRVFLKMDIEGAEYRVLDQILEVSDRLSGMVAEFHDIDLHMDRIEAFVKALPLRLCHVHCNNYNHLLEDGSPTAIECSFTRHERTGPITWSLPHSLDQACRADHPDYRIEFD